MTTGGFSEGSFRFTLAATTGGGGCASLANPEGRKVYVTALILDVTTKSTSACTLDAGIAANGTTSDDDLIDGVDVGTAVITASNLLEPGSNGKAGQPWGTGQFLTVSEKTGAIAGLVGTGLVKYIVV